MKIYTLFLSLILIYPSIFFPKNEIIDVQQNWPQWRGPNGNGISPNGNPPLEWSETKNIKWKVEIPGKGHSTPIVWENQIFLTSAIPVDQTNIINQTESPAQDYHQRLSIDQKVKIHQFVVLSLDPADGHIQWRKDVCNELPQDRTHSLGSWASNSPVTDGKNLYAYFGSRGLYCLDKKGNIKWEKDFGQMTKKNDWGEGSSPVLYKNKIILLWDHEGESFIFALDKDTGKVLWKVPRDENSSWTTPLVVENGEQTQIITSASRFVRSYNIENGDLIWQCSGLTLNVVATPIYFNDIIYVMSGLWGSALLAIDLNKAKGDISNSDGIIWKYNKDTPLSPSPILIDNLLYFVRSNTGYLSCLDAQDGSVCYSKNLTRLGEVFASPVAAKKRIYIVGNDGLTYVVKAGSKFEILAKNYLEDNFIASPVITGNTIYFRGYKHLYSISQVAKK